MKYSCLPDHCGQGVITRVSTYLAVQIRRTTSDYAVFALKMFGAMSPSSKLKIYPRLLPLA
jgi:hypothetical protein